jgi:hypothetical protein
MDEEDPDELLWVDSDLAIRWDADILFDLVPPGCDFAAFNEWPVWAHCEREITRFSREQGLPPPPPGVYFNSGVVFLRPGARWIYDPMPRPAWEPFSEQTWLTFQVLLNGSAHHLQAWHLPGRFNRYAPDQKERLAWDADFIHLLGDNRPKFEHALKLLTAIEPAPPSPSAPSPR